MTWTGREHGLLAVLAATMLVDAVEVSTALVAIPSIGRDLASSPADFGWTLTGFAVGFAGFLLIGPRLVDRLGHRRVYLPALLGLAATSILSVFVTGLGTLIAVRVAKGACAALTAPTGLAIIGSVFPPGPKRDRAMAVYALAGGAGFAAGLLLGGALTTASSWRWTLSAAAPLVLVLFLLGLRLIPGDRGAPAAGTPGVLRALFLTGGLLALAAGITRLPARPWAPVAAAVLLVFVLAARLRGVALLPAGLLRDDALRRSMLGAAALNGSFLGALLVLTIQLQLVLSWPAWQTALALLPAGLPLAFTSLFAPPILRRWGTRRLIALGTVPAMAAHLWLLHVGRVTSYPRHVLPVTLLLAAAFVLSFAALNAQAMSAVEPRLRAGAAGLYQTAVQSAAVIVPAAVIALLAAHTVPATGWATSAGPYRPALWLVVAVQSAGVLVAAGAVLPRPRSHRRAPGAVACP
jgi:MFS family permease